jgi:peptidoglycan/xylan/chitin deacetylase (PgdA/CDA1 family)
MDDPQRFLNELETACDLQAPDRAAERLFLDWNEAAEMVRGGMAVGSHTHTHAVLGKLTETEQVQELCRSRDVLRDQLSFEPEAVAYPVGSARALNADSERAAEAAGFTLAFRNDGGVNRQVCQTPYRLHRIAAAPGLGLDFFRLRTVLAASINKPF